MLSKLPFGWTDFFVDTLIDGRGVLKDKIFFSTRATPGPSASYNYYHHYISIITTFNIKHTEIYEGMEF